MQLARSAKLLNVMPVAISGNILEAEKLRDTFRIICKALIISVSASLRMQKRQRGYFLLENIRKRLYFFKQQGISR